MAYLFSLSLSPLPTFYTMNNIIMLSTSGCCCLIPLRASAMQRERNVVDWRNYCCYYIFFLCEKLACCIAIFMNASRQDTRPITGQACRPDKVSEFVFSGGMFAIVFFAINAHILCKTHSRPRERRHKLLGTFALTQCHMTAKLKKKKRERKKSPDCQVPPDNGLDLATPFSLRRHRYTV